MKRSAWPRLGSVVLALRRAWWIAVAGIVYWLLCAALMAVGSTQGLFAMTGAMRFGVLLLGLVVVVLRLVLVFVAPGLAVYLGVTRLAARPARKGSPTQ